MATMAYDISGSTFVSVNGPDTPTDEEWEAACHRMARRDFKVKLVWTAGGSPNSKQRMKTREILGDETEPIALVTSSMGARAVLGIMSLFFKNMRAFSPDQLQDALDYLEVPAEERQGVLELLERLQVQLGLKRGAAAAPGT